MPFLLAIESSTDIASVALSHGPSGTFGPNLGILSQQSSGVQTHSQTILPMVQALLAEAGIALSHCDAIAFGAGPGSFTGVRTACGIAQGLAFGCDLPVVAVDTLAAAAYACRNLEGDSSCNDILVALDARMGEVYWGQYRWPANGKKVDGTVQDYVGPWEVVTAPQLSAPSAVVPLGAVRACGNAFAVHAESLAACPISGPALTTVMPHAAEVAILGRRLFLEGKSLPARDAQPFYLRNDVALTTAERTRKKLEAIS